MPAHASYVAMDCEMVGTADSKSVLARVVLLDWKGRLLFDSYVKPEQEVTDYRTFVSGITADDLRDAPSFAMVRHQVQEMIHDKILVGHGLENDLTALQVLHPWWMMRDTAYYQPFMALKQIHGASFYGPRKLRDLCRTKLHREIQTGQHCPAEDARAAAG